MNPAESKDQALDVILASMITNLAETIDNKFLHVSKALATVTASTAAIAGIIISKGLCTEDELDELTKRSMEAIASSVKKMADNHASQGNDKSGVTKKAFDDFTSELNQTSSEPE